MPKGSGIRKGYIVIRHGNWDIPDYCGDGSMLGMDFAHIVIADFSVPPDTVDRANSFVNNKIIAFGFPDILLRPKDVFPKLLVQLDEREADVLLELFPAHDGKAMDMVDIDAALRVRAIHLKPRTTRLRYAWLCAVWTPVFIEFLHQFLRRVNREKRVGWSEIAESMLRAIFRWESY